MHPCRILLIDDDDLFRKSARLMLEHAGHAVTEASEGGEGIRVYRGGDIDVVITDLIMPGKEGLETIRELRVIDPKVRIIAISGGGRVNAFDYLPVAKAFGALRVLDKPFTDADLFKALEEVTGRA